VIRRELFDVDDCTETPSDPDTEGLGDRRSDAGAIRECEEHGWMMDRADPQAHDRAFDIARRDPPPGISPRAAAVVIAEVLESIGHTCPECPLD
jgi:hypothetical protein